LQRIKNVVDDRKDKLSKLSEVTYNIEEIRKEKEKIDKEIKKYIKINKEKQDKCQALIA